MSKFTVLIGMNGAGKTTILQALDFLSQLMIGDIDKWLQDREWTVADLPSKLSTSSNVTFSTSSKINGAYTNWVGALNRRELALLYERISQSPDDNKALLTVMNRKYQTSVSGLKEIPFTYQGSILSQLRDSELTSDLLALRDQFRQMRSLELLAPHLMRSKTRESTDDIGFGGQKLSSFLHGLKGDQKAALIEKLKNFYPNIIDFKATPTKGGWKRLVIHEMFDGKRIETEARHINDGLLRILAILAQTSSKQSMFLFDEIENGVNPEIVEKLVDVLVNAEQQILVTTHSPMILNYLEDAVAIESVQFIYKTPQGETRARPFFSIPRLKQKLTLMGAGEAFIDTDLLELTRECIELDLEDDRKKLRQTAEALRQMAHSDVKTT